MHHQYKVATCQELRGHSYRCHCFDIDMQVRNLKLVMVVRQSFQRVGRIRRSQVPESGNSLDTDDEGMCSSSGSH